MRLVIVSDTHNKLKSIRIPSGDILIHAGDATMGGTIPEISKFIEELDALPHPKKIIVSGNHDWLWQNAPYTAESMLADNMTYLEDEAIEIDGLKFYGSPWQPEFFNWAFNLTDERLKMVWDMIPDDTDVLITHGPPFGILDSLQGSNYVSSKRYYKNDWNRVGCIHLRNKVEKVSPKLHVFGHIHEGYGTIKHMKTTFINAAIMDGQYFPVNDPFVVDIEKNGRVIVNG